MNIKEYQTIIEETAVYPTSVDNFGLAYAWLGLIGETEECLTKASESIDKNQPTYGDYVRGLNKEFGDVLWYITAICKEVGIELRDVVSSFNGKTLRNTILDTEDIYWYSEKIKKFYRDSKELDTDVLINVLANNLFLLKIRYTDAAQQPLDLGTIMQMNYDKLIARRKTNTLHGSGDNREE